MTLALAFLANCRNYSESLKHVHNRNEAIGMYANKDLISVDESVQREALKNFYEQRAGVRKEKVYIGKSLR